MKKINDMGSEVVDGFKCKPKDFDPNRPIMHYKTHIFICDGKRCQRAFGEDRASTLRELLKELKLNRGKRRIKVSRGGCFGACRFRAVVNINENCRENGFIENDNIWLKQTHNFQDSNWKEILLALSRDTPLKDILDKEQFIPIKIY
jgi:cobalt-precorrin 5A hydrolase